ncbi:oxygen-dependent protoporphyrinogen oxidase [Granulicella aggregans]|uniref:Coproporphyrinogen III oxidase n=1 Tax=Granulicella aggregans TaxID=474949 RepID=A0A7W7ZBD5_9BACT|nr:protoporphyrinogen oxidase [Granulicella aggregans]MBB5056692.1 oxygen-dependent protoporphyrinogen oxidase [Granulicella aggregans]
MARRVAIVGGGVAGVTAAWQLARLAADGAAVEVVLFEASGRLGGIVETVRCDEFVIECGPDGWVTDKPWARELAEELGLRAEIISSNDATRKTYVLQDGELVMMPDGMRMMVPKGLAALDGIDASPLFSAEAKAAFRAEVGRAEELKAGAPDADESVASFVARHFGMEVLEKIGAPLLGGVFGGDVTKLSVRAVMAPFVKLEREFGSLVLGMERRSEFASQRVSGGAKALISELAESAALFTSLRGGSGALVERMVEGIPAGWVRLGCPVTGVAKAGDGWVVSTVIGTEQFDAVMMAAPVDVARELLRATDARAAELMEIEATSAVVAAFAFTEAVNLPQGFGFLVPPGSKENRLLAGTFVDQKYPSRVPEGGRLVRAFFGGVAADGLLSASDEEIAGLAMTELKRVLGKLPSPVLTVVRRWPRALPQYGVGHLERMAELFRQVEAMGGIWLLGNGYRGVGLPDLVRDARSAAVEVAG